MDQSVMGILRRLNVAQIRNDIIWDGVEQGEPDPRSYDEQLKEAERKVMDCISAVKNTAGPDAEEAALQEVRALLDTAKDIYTTIGMRVGAELAEQQIEHERERKDHTAPEPTVAEETGAGPGALSENDYFHCMADRVNLQVLGTHIRDGACRIKTYKTRFSERLDQASRELNQEIIGLVKDRKISNKVQDAINLYESTIIDVYFALGMKSGAQLHAQLMGGFDKDF